MSVRNLIRSYGGRKVLDVDRLEVPAGITHAPGGLGEPISGHLQTLNDQLIPQGALPAALLALAVQGVFDLLDRMVVPGGLRLRPSGD